MSYRSHNITKPINKKYIKFIKYWKYSLSTLFKSKEKFWVTSKGHNNHVVNVNITNNMTYWYYTLSDRMY